VNITTRKDLTHFLRTSTGGNFTSHGCYTLVMYCADGEVVHPLCVRANLKSYLSRVSPGSGTRSDRVVCAGTYDEGPALQCVECGEDIESSYGDPEETEG
jgi:hypothetical protein